MPDKDYDEDDEWAVFVPSYLRDQPRPPKSNPYTPHVYFISDGEAIKIGKAINPPKRLKNLQIGNPRELKMLGYFRTSHYSEGNIHRHFEAFWIRGEWFRDNPELRAFIAKNCPANDNQLASGTKAA